MGWAILAIFAGFHMVWMRYRFMLGGRQFEAENKN